MRGKLSLGPHRGCAPGNIPAYAGKTTTFGRVYSMPAEHPRVCGENNQGACGSVGKCGTSPRMRGKRRIDRIVALLLRNIPAYAGKTVNVVGGDDDWQEHPRVCGENSSSPEPAAGSGGTSPRMRGKPVTIESLNDYERNIPAYAGKTRCHQHQETLSQEHPRVCGENGIFGEEKEEKARNIPAYAGKTMLRFCRRKQVLEHPRVCGENCQLQKAGDQG